MLSLSEQQLRSAVEQAVGTETAVDATGSLVCLLCLEPSTAPADTTLEGALNCLIEACQPSPVVMHVELAIVGGDGKISHFATYLGQEAEFREEQADSKTFYTRQMAGRWRAIPIARSRLASVVQKESTKEVGAPYSLARYITSVPPFRALAAALPCKAGASGHCATISARILKRAFPGLLTNSSGWYSPSTLAIELNQLLPRTHHYLSETRSMKATGEEEEANEALQALLIGNDLDVARANPVSKRDAIENLALRASDPDADEVGLAVAQRQLANSLLRASFTC